MNTRRAQNGAFHDNRYMSSPEFAARQGLNAVAVAARASLLEAREVRGLMWFLQARSMEPGGLRKVADDIKAMFPGWSFDVDTRSRWDLRRPEPLEWVLADLCVNPRRLISENETEAKTEQMRARDTFPDLNESTVWLGGKSLKHLIEALLKYKTAEEERVRGDFVLTDNCQPIWRTLDFSLKRKAVTLITGAEGRGKTEAARTWCACHQGEARFVSLMAIATKTSAFREIGRALGVGSSLERTATQMQSRIEEVLCSSKLLLVLDEAHWLFNQGQRVYSRPELIDWIGTLSNRMIPVCLVTTPQFVACMARAHQQVGWNYRQFYRRVKRFVELGNTSQADLKRVAKHLAPGADATTLKLMVGHARTRNLDLSGLADLVTEARELAGGHEVTYEHVKKATGEPSHAAFALAMSQAAGKGRKRRRRAFQQQAPCRPIAAASFNDMQGREIRPLEPESETVEQVES